MCAKAHYSELASTIRRELRLNESNACAANWAQQSRYQDIVWEGLFFLLFVCILESQDCFETKVYKPVIHKNL